jgi:hypothetical protein
MKLKDIFSCKDFIDITFPHFIYGRQNTSTMNGLLRCYNEDESDIEIFETPETLDGLAFSVDDEHISMRVNPGKDGFVKSWLRERSIHLCTFILHKHNIKYN